MRFLKMPEAVQTAQPRTYFASLCCLALGLLVYFDLGPPLAFNDDWIYAWSVRRVVLGRGLHSGPEQSAAAVIHVIWGVVATLGHPDQRYLRLSLVPLAILGAFCAFGLARRLGSSDAWAWVAAAAIMTAPLYLSLATSYMTDAPFTALILATALASTVWIQDSRRQGVTILVATLATLERQTAVATAPALTLALVMVSRQRAVGRREWGSLALLWLSVLAAFALPLFVLRPDTQMAMLSHVGGLLTASFALRSILALPGPVGLLAIPFLGALGPALSVERRRIASVVVFATVCLGLFAGLLWIYPVGLFFGDYVTTWGLGPPHVDGGVKVSLIPPVLWATLVLLAALAFIAVLRALRTFIGRRESRAVTLMILLLGLAQTAPTVLGLWDRYYLPLAALMVPLCAAAASHRTPGRGKVWAAIAVGAGLAFYVAGEQDYQAWQVARDQAARLAYTAYPAQQVDAGYEADSVYVTIPTFEQNGLHLPGPPSYSVATMWKATKHPCAELAFAGPSDQHPGFSYRSLAPGRIAIVSLSQPESAGCRSNPGFAHP